MKASCSMFSQILKLIPRTSFFRLVKETKAEHRSKGQHPRREPCAVIPLAGICAGGNLCPYRDPRASKQAG